MKRVSIVLIAFLILTGAGFISGRIFIGSKNKEAPIAVSLAEGKTEVKEDMGKTKVGETAQDNNINIGDTSEPQEQIVDLLPTKENLYSSNDAVNDNYTDHSDNGSEIAQPSDTIPASTTKYPEDNNLKQQNVIETLSSKDCSYIIRNDNLYISYDGGSQWKLVPITLEELLDRGDGLIPLLYKYYDDSSNFYLEDESYYITPQKTVFVYGGSSEIPLSMISSNDGGNTWTKTVVDTTLDGVRRTFISFSENGDYGNLVVAGNRTMHSEISTIYKTNDGGCTWSKVNYNSWDDSYHFLTISATFSTDKIGFITTKGSQDAFYTLDGGLTWNPLLFKEKPESLYDLNFAYVKNFVGNKGTIYVGTYDLEKPYYYKYVTDDYGLTWKFIGVEDTVKYLSELQEYGI